MPRYSLKKALMNETTEAKIELLSEGWFTDLAAAIAAGGTQGIKDMIVNKLNNLSKMAGNMENTQALELVQRFRKMGLNSLGGESLERIERALRKQKSINDRQQGKNQRKVDTDKLTKLLFGELTESVTSYKGTSLKSVFLVD